MEEEYGFKKFKECAQIPKHIYIYLSIYNIIYIYIYIYLLHYIIYPPFLKVGGSKFRGEGKIQKNRGWKYGAVAGLLERVGGGLARFLFKFSKVYHFYI